MGVLQNVIREIGDIVNRLSVSSKEKQKIQEEIHLWCIVTRVSWCGNSRRRWGKKPGEIGCRGLGALS